VSSTFTTLDPYSIPVTTRCFRCRTHHVFKVALPVAAADKITVRSSTIDSIHTPAGMFANAGEGKIPPQFTIIPARKDAVLGTRATRDPFIVSTG
jgi:hypothetical protein